MKGQSLIKRTGFALAGLRDAVRREASFRTHLLAMEVVLITLTATQASIFWWAIGVLTMGLVLVAELLNSALETLADRLHPDRHPEIRAMKDMAAGAVLIASITALVIAALYLFGKIFGT